MLLFSPTKGKDGNKNKKKYSNTINKNPNFIILEPIINIVIDLVMLEETIENRVVWIERIKELKEDMNIQKNN